MTTDASGPREGNGFANPWLPQAALLQQVVQEAPGVATYRLRFVDPQINAHYRYLPGQFNMLYVPGVGESAISISGGSQPEGVWEHTIRVVGNVTEALTRVRVGTTIGLRGPYGSHWPVELCEGADVVLVAGGIGLPPLRPVVQQLLAHRQRYGRVTLLYGSRNPDDLMYRAQYSQWTAAGLDLHITVDHPTAGWSGNVGVVPRLMDQLPQLVAANTVIMMCGPEIMMRYTVASAQARGIADERIWVSLERNMQCATGLCGHCQLGPAFVCKDGPVFRYDKIKPFLAVERL